MCYMKIPSATWDLHSAHNPHLVRGDKPPPDTPQKQPPTQKQNARNKSGRFGVPGTLCDKDRGHGIILPAFKTCGKIYPANFAFLDTTARDGDNYDLSSGVTRSTASTATKFATKLAVTDIVGSFGINRLKGFGGQGGFPPLATK